MLGVLFGRALGVGIAFPLAALDLRVKTPREFERLYCLAAWSRPQAFVPRPHAPRLRGPAFGPIGGNTWRLRHRLRAVDRDSEYWSCDLSRSREARNPTVAGQRLACADAWRAFRRTGHLVEGACAADFHSSSRSIRAVGGLTNAVDGAGGSAREVASRTRARDPNRGVSAHWPSRRSAEILPARRWAWSWRGTVLGPPS